MVDGASVRATHVDGPANDDVRNINLHPSDDIIVRADPLGRILYVSPSCASLGWTADEVVGRPGLEMVHPDDRARFTANVVDALSEGPLDRSLDRRIRYLCKNGDWAWLEGNPQIVRNADGQPVELVNVFRNVTRDQRHLDEAAERARFVALTQTARRALKPLRPLKPV